MEFMACSNASFVSYLILPFTVHQSLSSLFSNDHGYSQDSDNGNIRSMVKHLMKEVKRKKKRRILKIFSVDHITES